MNSESIFEQSAFHYDIKAMPADRHCDSFPTHWHKFMEIVFVWEDVKEEAQSIMKVGQTSYTLHAGDILFIWPGELHELKANPDRVSNVLQFSQSLLDTRREFANFIKYYKRYHLLSFAENPERNLSMLFSFRNLMAKAGEKEYPFHEIEMLISLYEAFIQFGNSITNEILNQGMQLPGEECSNPILLAVDYIQKNCENDITLTSMAEYTGFSPCYFSRDFKKNTGYHFVEYLLRARIKKFQSYLADDSLSITEAAYQAGFKSISTLNRTFRQICGCSPSEYRKFYTNENR